MSNPFRSVALPHVIMFWKWNIRLCTRSGLHAQNKSLYICALPLFWVASVCCLCFLTPTRAQVCMKSCLFPMVALYVLSTDLTVFITFKTKYQKSNDWMSFFLNETNSIAVWPQILIAYNQPLDCHFISLYDSMADSENGQFISFTCLSFVCRHLGDLNYLSISFFGSCAHPW